MNDCVIQVRCKSTTLATILKYRHEEGSVVGLTQSTLVREALELVEQQILNKYPDMKFGSVSHAREYLQLKGFTKLNTGSSNRGEYTAFKMMREESISGTGTSHSIADLDKDDLESIVAEEMSKLKTQPNDFK